MSMYRSWLPPVSHPLPLSGDSLSLSRTAAAPIETLRLWGKAALSGAPSPEAPAALEWANAVSLQVTDREGQVQTWTWDLPLRGIPDGSGGWDCRDELEAETGLVRVRCLLVPVADGTGWFQTGDSQTAIRLEYPVPQAAGGRPLLCTHLAASVQPTDAADTVFGRPGGTVCVHIRKDVLPSPDPAGWGQFLEQQAAAGTPLTLLLPRAELYEQTVTPQAVRTPQRGCSLSAAGCDVSGVFRRLGRRIPTHHGVYGIGLYGQSRHFGGGLF